MRFKSLYLLALLLSPFAYSETSAQVTANQHVITHLPYAPCVGSPVLFSAQDTSGNFSTAWHNWNFGDGNYAYASVFQPSVSNVYMTPGTYEVMVHAWDSLTQAYDSSTVLITVDSTCQDHDLVSGTVYVDANANGSFDTGETPISGALLEINPGSFFLSSDANGNWGLNLPLGAYTIDLQPIQYHNYINPATGGISFTSTGTGAVSLGNDFGVQPQSNIQDLRVTLYAAPPVPGFARQYNLYYSNIGTNIMSGTIELELDPVWTINSSLGGTISGNTVTWNFTGLQPANGGYLNAVATLPPGTPLGGTLHAIARINPIPTDVAPLDNVDSLSQVIVGSYDPNDKQVSPAGEGAAGNVPLTTNEFTYNVRFQNTGTFYATDVVIRDTLDADLDRMTVEVLGSSHPMSWYLNQNELVFEFRNIMLPDSNTDEPGSHGWLRYSIDPKAGLPLGSEFTNSAAIYFDFNAPIITNTTLNTFANLVGMAPALNMLNPVSIAPHPVGSMATVRFSNPSAEVHTFSLMDLNGKVVRHIQGIAGSEFVLNRADLPAGLYVYRLDNAKAQAVSIGRLVVQ